MRNCIFFLQIFFSKGKLPVVDYLYLFAINFSFKWILQCSGFCLNYLTMIATFALCSGYLFSLRKLNNRTQINEHPVHSFKVWFHPSLTRLRLVGDGANPLTSITPFKLALIKYSRNVKCYFLTRKMRNFAWLKISRWLFNHNWFLFPEFRKKRH